MINIEVSAFVYLLHCGIETDDIMQVDISSEENACTGGKKRNF